MSAVKALQQWCRVQVQDYRDVSITNMTTSFRDGLAFCALIHKHRPDLINFDSLKKENVYENNKLAFGVAERELGIPALLDAEDMVALQVPDRLSILTYVSQYYNYFHGRSPIGGMGGIKRPADGPAEEPSGKKNPPAVSKAPPSPRPARGNSPPASRAPPSPRRPRNARQEPLVEKAHPTGTLSNKCVSCNKLVHLVQRHLVDGRLYHRSCAKSLAPGNAQQAAPGRDPGGSRSDASSRLGPAWLEYKSSCPPASPPVSALSQPATSGTTAGASARPTPAPRASTTAAKTLQSKIRFFQSGDTSNQAETTTAGSERGTAQPATALNVGQSSVGETPKGPGAGGGSQKVPASTDQSSKAKAAAFISRKLAEENNNKPSWTGVVLKKTEPPQVETPKAEGVGGKVRLKVDPSLLADLQNPKREESGPVPVPRRPPSRTPEPGGSKPSSAAPDPPGFTPEPSFPNTSVLLSVFSRPAPAAGGRRPSGSLTAPLSPPPMSCPSTPPLIHIPPSSIFPAGRLYPLLFQMSRSTLAAGASGPSPPRRNICSAFRAAPLRRPFPPARMHHFFEEEAGLISRNSYQVLMAPDPSANGPGKPQTSEPPGPGQPSRSVPAPLPDTKGDVAPCSLNGQEDQTRPDARMQISKVRKNGAEARICGPPDVQKKPGYIPKEEILKELQQIDDNLDKLEQEGVQLETRLRRDGEDDSFMDELMVEWFNLIRNKQVAMRRESELVYIGKTQELEEQQPSVEQELRRLMEKPEHLKNAWHRRREEELMKKLVEIVNDRNAIVEGLDEDRLREEEEDEQLNKMMKDFKSQRRKSKTRFCLVWSTNLKTKPLQ
uniref:Mical-like 2b n=2 Tax=Tetraodon nigroviridis TaxID=99883 RepID=H3CS36_TETNG